MKQNRLNAILKNLGDMNVEQMLITDPVTILYLTGRLIRPMERFYALYISANGNNRIFINILETVPEDLGVEKVRFADSDPYLDMVYDAIDHSKPLGVDKNITARFLLPLMERKAATAFINTSICADMARAVKDEEEKVLMRRASIINDQAMGIFKTLIHEGVTEYEVANQVKDIYVSLGGEDISFQPLVEFGANAACGHHYPDNTKVKPGDSIILDVGCIYKGYCSDMTRTFYLKEVSQFHEDIYNIVRKANETAESVIKPGMLRRDIDMTARNIITEAGYGPNFTHRLGHFIGLEVHDFGDISSSADEPVVPGNIFSIEPGIYLEGDSGVRIEDLVIVTEDGVEILNHYPKDIEIIE